MPSDNNINFAIITAYSLNCIIDCMVDNINIGQIYNRIISVCYSSDNGTGIYSIAVPIQIIETEGHITHGKSDVITIGISDTGRNNLLLRYLCGLGTLLLHRFQRLIDESLIVPRVVVVSGKVIFLRVDMLVVFIIINGVTVHQTALGNFGDAADMV